MTAGFREGRCILLDQIMTFLQALLDQTGAVNFTLGNLLMIIIGIVMIYPGDQ